MSSKAESELRAVYNSWTNERLIRATRQLQNEYRPEAVAAMLEELKSRGVSHDKVAEAAAQLPPPTVQPPTDGQKAFEGVGGYFQRKFIGFVVFLAAGAGLLATEFATRGITQSETYYQQHSVPRLIGACFAFGLSYATLRGLIWLVRWSSATTNRSKKDRELVGFVCYLPYILFVISLVVAFIDV